jgi:uncharacterized protein YodC (DUF2158 family)
MATQQQFKVGDLVELKSGGAVMTVRFQNTTGTYTCQWFAGKKLDDGIFPHDSLKPAVLKPSVPLASDEK